MLTLYNAKQKGTSQIRTRQYHNQIFDL